MDRAELIFFFLLIGFGYLLARFGLVSETLTQAISPLLMHVAYPAMIITSMGEISLEEITHSGFFVAISTLIITAFLFVTSGLALRRCRADRQAQLRFQLGVGNVVYVSIPLLTALFGPWILFIAIMHSVAQDILIWTLYYPVTLRGAQGQEVTRKPTRLLMTNPCILALLLALALKVSGLEIPGILAGAIGQLGGLSAPLALLYLGILLRRHGLLRWAGDRVALVYTAVKTIAIPLVVTGFLLILTDRGTALILGLLFGSPAPIMSIVWADHYGGDVQLAINCCTSSTLVYIILTVAVGLTLTGAGFLT